jgi:lipid II isoglutaminyl synthase (glutamine-hydrolysing)
MGGEVLGGMNAKPMYPSAFPRLRIAHLYPSLLNVAGDGGNVRAVRQRCAWRGIDTEVVDVDPGCFPDFCAFDLVMFHGGQDVEMAVASADLVGKAGKAASLRAAADGGTVIFAVCAGLQLLGHRYIPDSGPGLPGAAVLDLETTAGSQRFMQHAACEVTFGGDTADTADPAGTGQTPDAPDIEVIVGFENHSGRTVLGSGCRPLGAVIAGSGNNGVDGTEGARRDNVFATYLHGPVLPKNPAFADRLIRIALEKRLGGPVELEPLDDRTERRNHDAALEMAMRNRGRPTVLTPARLGGPESGARTSRRTRLAAVGGGRVERFIRGK